MYSHSHPRFGMPPGSSVDGSSGRSTFAAKRGGATPLSILAFLLALQTSSCHFYSFRAGAGLPGHIRTVAIIPFDNDTDRFELAQEIHRELLKTLPGALGLRAAGPDVADAIVQGKINGYRVSAPNYRSGGRGETTEVLVRRVTIGVQVEILDRAEDLILWEDRSLQGLGEYLEANETEEAARNKAIELLAQAIVDGAQSNW